MQGYNMNDFNDLELYEMEIRENYAGNSPDFLQRQYEIACSVKRECNQHALPIVHQRISLMQKIILEELDKQNILQ